jgi:hypothetical protein
MAVGCTGAAGGKGSGEAPPQGPTDSDDEGPPPLLQPPDSDDEGRSGRAASSPRNGGSQRLQLLSGIQHQDLKNDLPDAKEDAHDKGPVVHLLALPLRSLSVLLCQEAEPEQAVWRPIDNGIGARRRLAPRRRLPGPLAMRPAPKRCVTSWSMRGCHPCRVRA